MMAQVLDQGAVSPSVGETAIDCLAAARGTESEAAACCATAVQAHPAALRNHWSRFLSVYQPIFVIFGVALAGGIVLTLGASQGFSWARLMQGTMGFFLLPLALLKLLDLTGFVSAFARYDPVTKLFRPYGYLYPFLELGLALAFIAGFWPMAVYGATLVIMGIGAIGIVRVLARGEKLRCACVGTKIDVPLGPVSIAENLGMAMMSVVMLVLG